ncbi:MAG TPA: D-Ala-D-Ala carboxypeptidase family metallohydrolase [Sphingomicrobium sp.]|nr:D-Ala-D-Ala carboxypeptidase family metallohydrolase [Sphingomicrobium sp.]
MKHLLLPLLLSASAAAAQAPQPVIPASTPQVPAPAAWDPAAPYISAGQDEPGYRSWYLAAPWRAARVKEFNDYLEAAQVSGVLPTWQLLRTATSWSECGGQPFEIPPSSEWPHIVQTLRYVRDYVVPAIGPVEAVSVYRNPVLNKCAGGAPQSAHKLDSAIDMVPLRPTTREAMMKTLCGIHTEHGAAYSAGLGFYAYLRFHVDSTKFRRWNMDPAVAADCPPIIHPEDIASVGQPLPPASPTPSDVTPTAVSASTALPAVQAPPTETKPASPVTPPQSGLPHSQP